MWYDCRLWTLGRLGLRCSHTTTRNLILRGSTGKLRERGRAVAWDPRKDVDALLRIGVAGDPSRGVDTTRGEARIHGMVRTYSCEQESSRSTKGGGHRRGTSVGSRAETEEW